MAFSCLLALRSLISLRGVHTLACIADSLLLTKRNEGQDDQYLIMKGTIGTELDFKMLFEASPALFLVLKPDGDLFKIVGASDGYLATTMTQRALITGKYLFEVFPDNPNDLNASGVSNLRKSLKCVVETKRPHNMDIQKYDIQKPASDGGGYEVRYWSPYNSPVLNNKNEVEYIIHRVEDVTEVILSDKKNKEQLQLRGAELEVKSKLLNDNQKRINQILDALLRYTVMDFSQKMSISENADELDAIAIGLNTLSEELQDNIRQLKEGETKLEGLNSELEQKVIKRTEDLEKSERRFRSLLDNMLEGAQIIGFDWKYLYVNDTFVRHAKYQREEMLNYTVMEKFPGIEQTPVYEFYLRCFREREVFEIENKFVFPDGSIGWFELSFRPVPEGVFILSIDITERKRNEHKIVEMNRELEQKVLDRTEQIQTVNKELEAFSYSVSHDLRAPLRAVNGYAQVLHEDYSGKLDEEGIRIIDMVKYNATKMGTLIDDLLAFSRLGRKEVQKGNVNMNDLVEGVMIDIAKINSALPKMKISRLPQVKADYGLLYQAVYNLVSNAIKYSSKSKSALVEVFSEEKDNEIIFTVKDNGAGFDMRYANKLFGVFQRLHTQDDFDGTGVGLAIVQRVISKHGGKVWAHGEVEKGATFKFSLPKTSI